MKFTVLTLFPEQIQQNASYSILKKAQGKHAITIDAVNIRDFATDSYKTVDGKPYGGGQGMILRVDIVDKALQSVKQNDPDVYSILLDPRGETYTQQKAIELSAIHHIALICGHYEGIDERIRTLVDSQLSIGDYILTGGELGAMVIIDSITRLLPNVLSSPESSNDESFANNLLEYPQYTKPILYNGREVPEILRNGNHQKILEWKQQEAHRITIANRPDLQQKD